MGSTVGSNHVEEVDRLRTRPDKFPFVFVSDDLTNMLEEIMAATNGDTALSYNTELVPFLSLHNKAVHDLLGQYQIVEQAFPNDQSKWPYQLNQKQFFTKVISGLNHEDARIVTAFAKVRCSKNWSSCLQQAYSYICKPKQGLYEVTVFWEIVPKTLSQHLNSLLEKNSPRPPQAWASSEALPTPLLTDTELLALASHVLSGLEYLHNNNMAMKDLRPEMIGIRSNSVYFLMEPLEYARTVGSCLNNLEIPEGAYRPYCNIQVWQNRCSSPSQNDNLTILELIQNDLWAFGQILLEVGCLTTANEPLAAIHRISGHLLLTTLMEKVEHFLQLRPQMQNLKRVIHKSLFQNNQLQKNSATSFRAEL